MTLSLKFNGNIKSYLPNPVLSYWIIIMAELLAVNCSDLKMLLLKKFIHSLFCAIWEQRYENPGGGDFNKGQAEEPRPY